MAKQKVQQKEEGKTPTPEEMEKRKKELTKFYTEQIGFLTTQLEYEELLTKIEDSRARRVMAQMRVAQMLAGPEPENPENEDNSDTSQSAPEMVKSEEGVSKDQPIHRTLKRQPVNE